MSALHPILCCVAGCLGPQGAAAAHRAQILPQQALAPAAGPAARLRLALILASSGAGKVREGGCRPGRLDGLRASPAHALSLAPHGPPVLVAGAWQERRSKTPTKATPRWPPRYALWSAGLPGCRQSSGGAQHRARTANPWLSTPPQVLAFLRSALRKAVPRAEQGELKAQLAACYAPVDLEKDHQLWVQAT